MKRYRVHIAIAAVLCGLVVIGYVVSRDREPSYQGVRLSEWVRQACEWKGTPGDPTNAKVRARATEAVQQIGTNAIPWLLEELQAVDAPPWRAKLSDWLQKIGARTNRAATATRVATAHNGFVTLGPIAKPALPAILALKPTQHFNLYGAYCIAAKVDPLFLVGKLNSASSSERRQAADTLSGCPTDYAAQVVPPLKALMEHDPDADVRLAAAESLSEITGDRLFYLRESLASSDRRNRDVAIMTELLVPVHEDRDSKRAMELMRRLTPELRCEVAKAAKRFTAKVPGVIPLLEAMLQDEDERVRAAAKKAIDAFNAPLPAQR